MNGNSVLWTIVAVIAILVGIVFLIEHVNV